MRAAAALACAVLAGACRPASSDDTLRFWAFGREGEVVTELVRDFEREHPGIRVRVQQLPWTAAHEKLLTAHVGGATPDLAQLGNTWIPEFITLGALEPLDAWRARSGVIDSPSYFPGIWATNVGDGRLYGIPWYVDTRVLFYRKDLLAQAGYESVPGDWAGWREAMAVVARRTGHSAILMPINEWPPIVIFGLQAGSPLITDEGYGAFGDTAFARGFGFLMGLFRDGLAPPLRDTEVANLYQEFARGTFAMYISGPWNLGEFRRRLPPELQDQWGTTPLPGPTGPESGVSLAGGSSLVMFRDSPHKEAAWQLIEFLSRPDVQARFYRMSGDLPARIEAWEDSALSRDPEAEAFRVQLERVVPTPMIPEWEQVTTKVMDWAETAIRGGNTPERALASLDEDVDRLLERRRWLLSRHQIRGGEDR